MNNRGLGPLISTLSHMGGWPMIMETDEWNEEEYTWRKVDDNYMRLTGENTFFAVTVEELMGENKMYIHVCIVM